MELPSAFLIAASFPFLYAFFCIVGVDPQANATYYVGNPWSGYRASRVMRDHTFSLSGIGPLLYTALVIAAEQVNKAHCSMRPPRVISVQTALAAVTVFLVGKILFGPIVEVRKSIKIVGERKYERPLSFILYDWLMMIPVNFSTGLIYRWAIIGAIAAVISLLFWLGTISASNSFIPIAIILPWAMVSLGRVSALMITGEVPHVVMVLVYLGSIVMLAVVWSHAILLLSTCGVQANFIPSYGSLIGGLFH
ncbi:MAG: hypothetical protein JOY90_16820 [Bradyrhizobium sp.]|uniref:hypothetical protein n=1 Tax=Bradyrhizobium sp. TaxID=376 RepID=UPI001DD83C0F|nr:hypothetical protein [Bradyrhizobium sp.]MBV9562087.1 hypothetical protein [Bradyrhizobium sp.]